MDCCKELNEWKEYGKHKGYWFHYKKEVIDEYLKNQGKEKRDDDSLL